MAHTQPIIPKRIQTIANEKGWCVSYCGQHAYGPWQIQSFDIPSENVKDDMDAWLRVGLLALHPHGEKLVANSDAAETIAAKICLDALKLHNTQEYDRIVNATLDYIGAP